MAVAYGRPHRETLATLGEAAVPVYGTDTHETVIVTNRWVEPDRDDRASNRYT